MNKKFSALSTAGIGIVVGIAAFIFGIQFQSSPLASKISEQLSFSNQSNSELPADLEYGEVERVYDELRKSYYGDLNVEQLIEGMKAGLVSASGDPYTVYLDAEAVTEFNASLNQEFSGIGAEIAVKGGQLQIVAPLDGTPAASAGLRPSDPILAIDGEPTDGITVEEAVTKIRGEEGTEVTLTLLREGQAKEVKITRAQIDVPNATGEVLEGNIGYIDLTTFGEDAVQETTQLAQQFKNQNVTGLILDMRNNSGGLLNAAVDVSSLWLNNKVVVEQKGDGNNQGKLISRPGAILEGIPTVVLINGGSASASEIVAGALKDHGVATVVGEQSFGKGSVQSLEHLPGGAQLKVTIARWFTPNGQNIDEEGITPDVEIKLTTEDFDADRDPQLDRALELLKQN